MSKKVLITGGAGFIGSHVADELLRAGHQVRALDCLCPQVHPGGRKRPDYLDTDVELVLGDVRDPTTLGQALRGIDVVFHFAARVGVGQSMYAIREYTSINNEGTAILLESLMEHPVERLIVASSMSLYGEGLFRTAEGASVPGTERCLAQLRAKQWDVRSDSGEELIPVPTPESKPPSLASIYALSKFDQERMCFLMGRAYKLPTVAL